MPDEIVTESQQNEAKKTLAALRTVFCYEESHLESEGLQIKTRQEAQACLDALREVFCYKGPSQ